MNVQYLRYIQPQRHTQIVHYLHIHYLNAKYTTSMTQTVQVPLQLSTVHHPTLSFPSDVINQLLAHSWQRTATQLLLFKQLTSALKLNPINRLTSSLFNDRLTSYYRTDIFYVHVLMTRGPSCSVTYITDSLVLMVHPTVWLEPSMVCLVVTMLL